MCKVDRKVPLVREVDGPKTLKQSFRRAAEMWSRTHSLSGEEKIKLLPVILAKGVSWSQL